MDFLIALPIKLNFTRMLKFSAMNIVSMQIAFFIIIKLNMQLQTNNVKLTDSIHNFVLLAGIAEFYDNNDKLIAYNNPLLKLLF